MIFVVEDEPVLRRSLVEFLASSGEATEGYSSAEEALTAARAAPPDAVVSDLQLPGMGGFELLAELARIDSGIVRIMVTAHATTQSAVAAMRMGCYEYLEKPVDLQQLVRLVKRALAERRAGVELAWHRKRDRGDATAERAILGEGAAVAALRQQIATLGRLGASAPPVLVHGETGVGKGVLARAIHDARFPKTAPWIEVNCAALPATLVEAELFGHERSAFTDAKEAKAGLFEAATGGTIFLDEVGELPMEVQSKLLKAVESSTIRRLGSLRDRKISAAIMAATNVDIPAAIAAGKFRADLYHRLAAFTVTVPPLRERGRDAVILASTFLVESAAKYRKRLRRLLPEAEQAILSYSWPGNVRELRFAIDRAAILAPDDAEALDASQLVIGRARDSSPAPPSSSSSAPISEGPVGASIEVADGSVRVRLPKQGIPFAEIEQAVLAEALRIAEGNVVRAARMLGLNRDALRYRIRKFNLAHD